MSSEARARAYLQRMNPPEDEPLRAARARSEEADLTAVPYESGVMLRWLARLEPAKTAVEIGSGGGYSGLWLLAGMHDRGALTTIEIDPGHQALAQQAFAEAGQTHRVRSILGPALSVLDKLADTSYDLVFIDADLSEYPGYLNHARRLLRPGGLLIADDVWYGGQIADAPDSEQVAGLRSFIDAVAEDDDFDARTLLVGDGLLVAVYHP